ncbi:MAG: OmcA/MtrC family decaheme c-type cytochrome, partial [Myxococcales bacterium]|nr:OmcA/MtrC family decaheme c-type cytochrome [Myxococcales bacterium]
FVPDGGDAVHINLIDNDTCTNCHVGGFDGHGGRWTEPGSCQTCHTLQTTDPESGNTVAFGVMLHKLHAGAGLPSVQAGEPYQIIGYRNTVYDFSDVHLPRPVTDCNACHAGDAPDAWQQAEFNACTSCHDRTAFALPVPEGEGWALHSAGPQAPNSCGNCHGPVGGPISVTSAHLPPEAALDLVGLNITLLEASNVAPGQNPTVYLTLTNDAGAAVDPASLDFLEIVLAGPTSGYDWSVSMRNVHQAVVVDGDRLRVDLNVGVPAEATGSIAIGAAGYRYLPYGAGRADSIAREYGGNPVLYAALGGGDPVMPQAKVTQDACNACHGELKLHGTFRRDVEYCVTCHNDTATDAAVRPEGAGDPASIDFGPMVHRIHAGAHLNEPAVIYGFGGSEHNYGEVHYPGDLSACSACHQSGADVPSTKGCTSCHDSSAAKAHAALETAPDGTEACGVCHSVGREAGVDKFHTW